MKNNRLIYILLIGLFIWCVILTSIFVNKNDENQTEVVNEYNITGFSTDFTKIVDEKKNSIVTITTNGTVASGFVYKQDGDNIYIVTAYHAVSEADSCTVSFVNGYATEAEVIGKSIYGDVAVLKIESPYIVEPLKLGDCTKLSAGEYVVSIGTPVSIEYQNSVEIGMVSNSVRSIINSVTAEDKTVNYYIDAIQLSSNLKPGYSGSPVINMNGDVIGMNTMSLINSFNFAITSNEMSIIADRIINGEVVTKYQLGVKGSYINQMELFERSSLDLSVDVLDGMYVMDIIDNSLAQVAGVKKGDVIISINGQTISNFVDYLNVVYTQTDSFEFVVLSEGVTNTYTVEIND